MVSTDKFNLLHSYIFRKKNVIMDNTSLYKDKSILYISQNGTSGYANAAKGYIYDYIGKKIPVKTQYFNCNDEVNENDRFHEYLNSTTSSDIDYNTIIVHSTPDIWTQLIKNAPNINLQGKTIIGRTVWEFEKLLPAWVNSINVSIVDIVSVPTEWNKQCFINNGVIKPIIVEPHIYIDYPYKKTGLNHLLTKSIMISKNTKTLDIENSHKFYCIGQLIERKGIIDTIDAFCNAFTSNDNVVLFVKTFKLNYTKEEQQKCINEIVKITNKYNHAPIIYIKDNLNYDEIKSLHDIGDCYFHLTKTEGFCLGAFDAFNNDKKVIITGYGGHTEYLGKDYNGLVDYKLNSLAIDESVFFQFKLDDTYQWAIANKNHAIHLLKNKIKKETVELYLDKNFYPKETFENKNDNISRWINGYAEMEFNSIILNENVTISFTNHNPNNKSIKLYTDNIVIEKEIPVGSFNINFNFKGKYIKIKCETTFEPRLICAECTDTRILGIVINDISISNKNIVITNKFLFDNLKKDINYNSLNFNSKLILNKKVGIIGYIPSNDSTSTHISFLKNINRYKSFADIILFSEGSWGNTLKVENPIDVVDKHKDKIGLWTFYHCLRIAKKYNLDYFLMLESDCRVFKNNWDYELFECAIKNDVYCHGSLNINNFHNDLNLLNEINVKNKNSYYNVINHGKTGNMTPTVWTNGALTVYKTDIFFEFLNDELTDILKHWTAWDFDSGYLIIKSIGLKESIKKITHCDKIASNVDALVPLSYVIKNRNVFNAIHPVKTKWSPPISNEYNFYHGGDLGDIIYSLPSIKLIGGGNLIIGNHDFSNEKLTCREKFNSDRYNFILPLLKTIDYIKIISYNDVLSTDVDYNFNEMRYYWNDADYRKIKKIDRLTDAYLDLVGVLPLFDEKQPWITVDKKFVSRYIISRSFRYRDNDFPWKEIYEIVKNDVIFIGTIEEYNDFCTKFGYIKHYIVKDALDMAQVINGAKCFIGNQSFPCSLAVALNIPIIQEYFDAAKDCIYIRDNFKTKENYKDIFI